MTIIGGRRRQRSRTGAVLFGVVTVVVAALVLVPDLLGIDGVLPFVVFVALRPFLAGVIGLYAVVRLAVAALRRRRPPLAVAGVLVVVLVALATLVPRAVDDEGPPPAGSRSLTLLSFNVYYGEADVGALASLLRERRPDLVVLPESAERYRAMVTAAVPEMGYRSWVAAAPGAPDVEGVTVLASPAVGLPEPRVIGLGVDPWLELTGGALGPVRLLGVHAAAPTPGKIASWPREQAALSRWCAGGGPAILAGDFNASLDHTAFRDGTRGCRDTGEATGTGLVGTWDARWPSVMRTQIDHVLTQGGPTTSGLEILDVPGSDHRALLTTVHLP